MKTWFPLLLMVFATFFWGATFIMVKATITIIPLNFFLFLRFGLATALTFPILFGRKQFTNIKLWKQGGILGILLFLSYYFQTVGLFFTTPAKASFITGLNVVMIPILAFLIYGKRPKLDELIAVGLAIVGTVLLTINPSNITTINIGDLIILLTAICIALHILYTESVISTNLVELLWIQFLTMTILAGVFSVFTARPSGSWYYSPTVIITLIFTVLLATIFAFGAQFYAQQAKIPPTHLGIIFLLEPVFTLIIDIIAGIIPTQSSLIGMGLILVSFVIITINIDSIPDL